MPDTRPRVTASKPVDLDLLTAELGGVGLCGDEAGVIVAAEGARITQKQLADAVAAHKAPSDLAPVEPLTDAEITAVRALLTSR